MSFGEGKNNPVALGDVNLKLQSDDRRSGMYRNVLAACRDAYLGLSPTH